MILYKAEAGDFTPRSLSDSSIIYLATLYPMVFWHLSPDRNFGWFIENDFFRLSDMVPNMQWILDTCNLLYWLLILVWLGQGISDLPKESIQRQYRQDPVGINDGC